MVAIVRLLKAALEVDEVVIGGGNAKRIDKLPRGVWRGSNAHAFIGGYRRWARDDPRRPVV